MTGEGDCCSCSCRKNANATFISGTMGKRKISEGTRRHQHHNHNHNRNDIEKRSYSSLVKHRDALTSDHFPMTRLLSKRVSSRAHRTLHNSTLHTATMCDARQPTKQLIKLQQLWSVEEGGSAGDTTIRATHINKSQVVCQFLIDSHTHSHTYSHSHTYAHSHHSQHSTAVLTLVEASANDSRFRLEISCKNMPIQMKLFLISLDVA